MSATLLNKIKKHLEGHIKEGNFDNLDISQLKQINTSLSKMKKGSKSKTHIGDLDYTTKKGDKVFHEGGHDIKKSYKPYDKHKGSVSKTHKGELDYTTKKGDKVFHEGGHYVHKLKLPYEGGGMLKITICHDSDSDSDEGYNSDSEYEGEGISDVFNKIISGKTGMSPNVKRILDKYGHQTIQKIDIVRNPVGKMLIGALSIASGGEFGRNLENSPYDKLFHLKIVITLQDNTRIAFEKVERVSMTVNPKPVKNEESINASLNGQTISLFELFKKTEQYMGDKFYPYSARDNNCQNFIMSVLKANNIGNESDYTFVKQDTKELFGENSFLRKASNTITDIGARFNVLTQGGMLPMPPQVNMEQLAAAIDLIPKEKKSHKGLFSTTAIPKTGGKVTFKDFAHGWARHHKITHGGALKSKKAKETYKIISDDLIKEGKGWDDFIHGAKTFFTGGYNQDIKNAFTNVGDKIKSGVQDVGRAIRDQADKVINDVKNGIQVSKDEIQSLMNKAEITAEQKFDLIKAYAQMAANKIKSGVMTGVNFVVKYGRIIGDWLKDHENDFKKIAISLAKFAVKHGLPLTGEVLGGLLGDALAAGVFQPELIPVAQAIGSMAGKRLGELLRDYFMSLGLADAEGNIDADKYLDIVGETLPIAMATYNIANSATSAKSGADATTSIAKAGTGMKKRGRPRKH